MRINQAGLRGGWNRAAACFALEGTKHMSDTTSPMPTPKSPQRKFPGRILWSLMALAALSVSGGLTWLYSDSLGAPRVIRGVQVAKVDVSMRTESEVNVAVEKAVDEILQSEVRVEFGDRTWVVLPDELGIRVTVPEHVTEALKIGREGAWIVDLCERLQVLWRGREVALKFEIDKGIASRFLDKIAPVVYRPAVDASLKFIDPEVVSTIGKFGYRLDRDGTFQNWQSKIRASIPKSLQLVVHRLDPEVHTGDVASVNGIIGEFSTLLDDHENRRHNIRRAMEALEGTLIRPGEEFSFNESVGRRSSLKGYRPAPVFVRRKEVDALGGGVCQVSSTLYNAAVLSGLTVLNRAPHSRPVEYVQSGRDATVAYGLIDLKLRNDLPDSVWLRMVVEGGHARVIVLGNRLGAPEYQIEREVLGVAPIQTVFRTDPRLPSGEELVEEPGRKGYRIATWRVKVVNGEPAGRERLAISYYPPSKRVVRTGSGQQQSVTSVTSHSILKAQPLPLVNPMDSMYTD